MPLPRRVSRSGGPGSDLTLRQDTERAGIARCGSPPAPEPSFGTHFFRDLTEAQIYSVAVRLDAESSSFNRDFFYATENALARRLPTGAEVGAALRLIEVAAYAPGRHLDVIMDDERGETLAYLAPDA